MNPQEKLQRVHLDACAYGLPRTWENFDTYKAAALRARAATDKLLEGDE